MTREPRLLCIDLQTDEGRGLAPDARAVFGARQLLSIARRCSWPVIHTRLRGDLLGRTEADTRIGGLRPLTSERVFLRDRRSIADCQQLIDQLEQWERETVYVAAFDALALLSLLIDRIGRGPDFVLVEDAIAANLALTGRAALDPFCSAAYSLAPTTSIPALAADFGRELKTIAPQGARQTHH